MKPVGQPEQAGCCKKPMSRLLHMLAHKFLCTVNNTIIVY